MLEALAYSALEKKDDNGAIEAIRYLNQAVQQGSTLPADFEQLGSLLVQARHFAEATDLLQQGIRLIPHDGELYRLLAACYLAEGKARDAAEVLNEGSRIFPENAAIRALLVEVQKNHREQLR